MVRVEPDILSTEQLLYAAIKQLDLCRVFNPGEIVSVEPTLFNRSVTGRCQSVDKSNDELGCLANYPSWLAFKPKKV
jgi:hypothetical protein